MASFGLSDDCQASVLRLVAGILHLGNLAFTEQEDRSQVAPVARDSLATAAQLLGLDAEGLERVLTTRVRMTPDGEWALLGQ